MNYMERRRQRGVPPGGLPVQDLTHAAAGELVTRAEQEYRGAVVQTGPTPEHREPLADYVARVTEPIVAALETELPPGHRLEFDATPQLEFDETRPETYPCAQPGGDCGCTGTGLLACPGRAAWAEDDDSPDDWPIGEAWPDTPDPSGQLVDVEPAADLPEPLPPATDTPGPVRPKPRRLPCEVCGVPVLTSYVEKTGRQRHGHHPEGA